ncbi:hypothetical protein [Paenibacillus agilis]|uniref:Uncharacterized protein n=1 Tax=Paenibacillus agilis TaxID=3020863 RepID=A0A559IZG8_9BACL|nr:hypothetical protein [Paenibacillus agilis]TVX93014.1 hypothetical protein FPZ44_08055 [Paenibacillus agilis]
MSLNVTREQIEVVVTPKMNYTPSILSVRTATGIVEIQADDDQLAEIEHAIKQHLDSVKYSTQEVAHDTD